MLIEVKLSGLLDGNFKFYLEDSYRNKISKRLKQKYRHWNAVAKALDIDLRSLFGIRRAFEVPKGQRKIRYISTKHLKSIISDLNLDIKEVEKQITHIKLGQGGFRSEVSLPTQIELDKEPLYTINRALAEYLFATQHKTQIDNLPSEFTNEYYVTLNVKIQDSRIESLRLRGLKPSFLDEENYYTIRYRNPGTNDYIEKTVPKRVVFNEEFAKEFGKWIGDRCGGPHKVGVANKQPSFIQDFNNILGVLHQPYKDIHKEITCSTNFEPSEEILTVTRNVRHCKTQYGEYAYKIEVANKLLRNLVFDVLERNLFPILSNSKPEVIVAFYCGLFEAEGSVDLKSREILISSGLNLNKSHTNEKVLSLLKEVIAHIEILKLVGLKPQISRRVGRTNNSSLKYEIRLKKDDALLFAAKTASFINHPQKAECMIQIGGGVK